jgi:hypothetical protein
MPKEREGGGKERVAGESKNGGGLSVKQRKHVTPAPAPICLSPGVTWPGRAESPAHVAGMSCHRLRCPSGFLFLRRGISGNQSGRAAFLQHPLHTFPYRAGRARRTNLNY